MSKRDSVWGTHDVGWRRTSRDSAWGMSDLGWGYDTGWR